jgi:hypothetical protein
LRLALVRSWPMSLVGSTCFRPVLCTRPKFDTYRSLVRTPGCPPDHHVYCTVSSDMRPLPRVTELIETSDIHLAIICLSCRKIHVHIGREP